ncbi:MAG: proton-conducting transporter membrane subunit [Dehalococcoidia bacterium]
MNIEIHSIRPLIAILLPGLSLLGLLVIPGNRQRLKKAVHVAASLAAFGVVLSLMPGIIDEQVYGMEIISIVERISIHLTVDALGYYYGLALTFLWLLANIYSLGYIKHKDDRYYAFMALCNSFLLGCAFSQNIFTYFIFYELMTLASFPLIIHDETDAARHAGIKYLKYAIPAGAVILFAVLLHYFWAGGNLSLVSLGTLSLDTASRTVLTTIFIAYFAGFGVKAAIVPLEGWVPDAHPAAPAPASALLSGVILKAGAFGIIRVVLNIFGLDLFHTLNLWIPVVVFASITIVLGSVRALAQDNLKRRLAYSSVGQVSYILLGIALMSPLGVLGGIIHLAHHALMKGCLFLCSGTILKRTGKTNISEMAGIGYQLPVTMICFSISALAMMGTPLTVGFVSKWLLGTGAIQANMPLFIVILLISALLTAAYYLPIIYTAFFRRPKEDNDYQTLLQFRGETKHTMLWPTVVLAVLVIVAGVWVTVPGFPHSFASIVTGGTFP